MPQTADREESSSPPRPKRLFRRYKDNAAKNPTGDSENLPTPDKESPLLHGIYIFLIQIITANIFEEKNLSDADAPQDGKGDPNLSGIAPPLPTALVEPPLHEYATGYYVITAGTEVGITTVKCVYFTLQAVLFLTLSQRYCRIAPRLRRPFFAYLLHMETSEVVLQHMLQ